MSSENGPPKNALKNTRFGSAGDSVTSNSPSLGASAKTWRAAEPSGLATHRCGGVVRDSCCQPISPLWPGGVAAADAASTANRANATAPPVKRNDMWTPFGEPTLSEPVPRVNPGMSGDPPQPPIASADLRQAPATAIQRRKEREPPRGPRVGFTR